MPQNSCNLVFLSPWFQLTDWRVVLLLLSSHAAKVVTQIQSDTEQNFDTYWLFCKENKNIVCYYGSFTINTQLHNEYWMCGNGLKPDVASLKIWSAVWLPRIPQD